MRLTSARSAELKERVRARAPELGLSQIGFAAPAPGPEAERLLEWLGHGHHGAMAWLERDPERRADPRRVLPEAGTVVVASALYDRAEPRTATALEGSSPDDSPAGWISRYAWGDDYHDWLLPRIRKLEAVLMEELGEVVPARSYVDTGPVMEKAVAARAGLGWIGKNSCLIAPDLGSYLFLGAVLLGATIEPDGAGIDRCGSCTACLEVCPTDAFPAPYVVDARRCISYLSIEHRGEIDAGLEEGMGVHVFGCDLCQDVCPWTRKSPTTEEPHMAPRAGAVAPDLVALASLSEEAFRERFRKSPLKRTKRRGVARNAAIALGNSKHRDAPAALAALADDEDAVVAATARRALDRLAGDDPTG